MRLDFLSDVKYLPLYSKVRLSLTSKTNFLFPVPAVPADIQTVENKRKTGQWKKKKKKTFALNHQESLSFEIQPAASELFVYDKSKILVF